MPGTTSGIFSLGVGVCVCVYTRKGSAKDRMAGFLGMQGLKADGIDLVRTDEIEVAV